jgi:AcrR family transcriptional regulator
VVPNRAEGLTWLEPQPPTAGGLSRATIVAAAMELADREGVAAVSIRRVAAALDVRPMSLYTHIASKADLLDLMVNQVSATVLVDEPQPTTGARPSP